MKYLILLALLASCGKNEMPGAKDLYDSDGDQVANEYDTDKDIANIEPLELIQAKMSIQTLKGPRDFTLTNKTDMEDLSKNLLVKNKLTLKSSSYFTEYSTLKMTGPEKVDFQDEGLVHVVLRFPSTMNTSGKLYLASAEKRDELGDWKHTIELLLPASDVKLISEGKLHFHVNNLEQKRKFDIQTQEESIAAKTYRVLLNDGETTKVYYISRSLTIAQIVSKFNIDKYRLIDQENLLTTAKLSTEKEWWVRNVNNRDVVIVKGTMNDLSDHYLKGFQKSLIRVTRTNGLAGDPLLLNKHPQAKSLLKIRGDRTSVTFVEETRTEGQGGRKDDAWRCTYHTRVATNEVNESLKETDIAAFLQNNYMEHLGYKHLTDKKGDFWEVEFSDEDSKLKLRLDNLPTSEYVQEGLYAGKCVGAGVTDPKIKPNLHTPERSLNLEVEAFVEKI